MTSGSVERALEAAQSWLEAQDAPEALIVAHEAGRAADPEAARRWVRRILADQDTGGSWGGELLATSEALRTLAEIRTAASLGEQDPGIGRAIDWLRARRGVPGAWSDGCTTDRHRAGTCHHFLGAFFSPAPPEVPQERVQLRSGARVEGDAEVRFVVSVCALDSILQWVEPSRDALLHLEGLRRVIGLWPDTPPSELSTVSLLSAIKALLRSPAEDDRAAAEGGLRVLAGRQRGDGSWVDTDPFQALEVFSLSESAGVDPDRSRRALWHGARLLVAAQKSDGSWGGEEPVGRAFIAWKTLRRVDPRAPA